MSEQLNRQVRDMEAFNQALEELLEALRDFSSSLEDIIEKREEPNTPVDEWEPCSIIRVFVDEKTLENAEYNAIWKWVERNGYHIRSKGHRVAEARYMLHVQHPDFVNYPTLGYEHNREYHLIRDFHGELQLRLVEYHDGRRFETGLSKDGGQSITWEIEQRGIQQ